MLNAFQGRFAPTIRSVVPFGILAALIFGGCGDRQGPATGPPAAAVATVEPPSTEEFHVGNYGEELTEEEVREFGRTLIAAVGANDEAAYQAIIDMDAILHQAIEGTPVPAKSIAATVRSFRAASRKDGDPIFRRLVAGAAGGGSITLLHARDRDGEPWALFRVIEADASVTYKEYRVVRRPDGKVRAVDLFSYEKGERVVETLRRSILAILARGPGGDPDPGEVPPDETKDALVRHESMVRSVREGRPREALATFDALPAGLAGTKTFLLDRLDAAGAAGNPSLRLAAANAIRDRYPEEGWVDLIALRALAETKDHAAMEAAYVRLDRAIGGDPYLESLRALNLVDLGRPDDARELARAAAELEPDLGRLLIIRAQIALRGGDPDEILARLRDARDEFDIGPDAFARSEGFAAFSKTPQGATYRAETPSPDPVDPASPEVAPA